MRPTALNLALLIVGLVVGIAGPVVAAFIGYITKTIADEIGAKRVMRNIWSSGALLLLSFICSISLMVIPQSMFGWIGVVPLIVTIIGTAIAAENFGGALKGMRHDHATGADVRPIRSAAS